MENFLTCMTESHIPVKEFMVKSVVTVNSKDSIKETAKTMYLKKVGSVIVIENKKPVGIITLRDIVNSIGPFENPLKSQVKEIMSQPLIHIHPDESIIDVAEIMTSKNIHKIPVIVDDEILGIISSSDLVVLFSMLNKEDLVKIFKSQLHE
jgi:CBS domain-containing protein